jgi:CBS domain-containing protein
MPAPNSLILATVEHLSRFAPFNSMQREHVAWLAARLEVTYYGKGETVLGPDTGPVKNFYIIKQGVINAEQDVVRAQDNADWLELHEGECFPLGALLSRRAVASTYRAGRDTFCFEMPVADFHELLGVSDAFRDFCTRRIANLLEQSKQALQAQYAKSTSDQQSMSSPLASLIRREPVSCSPDTPLREALQTMHRMGIGSMVAVDEHKKPVGIFTLHDVLNRVTLKGVNLDVPFSSVMSPNPRTLPPHAMAHDAALVMAKHGFRHILIEEDGQLKGLISEKDLFSLQRVGLRQISGAIRNADHLETLKHSAKDIRQLAHNMLAQGVAAEQLTQIISTLNDLLTSRIIELELATDPVREIEFCWIALGSEGRLEQTLNTDQDNGIMFVAKEGENPDELRNLLLPFAKRINLALAECGFPLCKGEIMASNPKWCLTLQEWKQTFAGWINLGDPEALLHCTIFFDFRPLYGADALAGELREWLSGAACKNTRFLHQMVENALRNRPPSGSVWDFFASKGNSLDLKLNGITPFVDAARIFSLAAGGRQTNTLLRLRESAEALRVSSQETEAWCDAFLFIQLLRLRLHHEQCERQEPLSNNVDPDSFNNLDKRILKEAFRQARKLQTKLALDYQL